MPTRLLDDAAVVAEYLAVAAEIVADTHLTGGTAIAGHCTIIVRNTDDQRILRVSPDDAIIALIEDPRLFWVDAMWLAGDGRL